MTIISLIGMLIGLIIVVMPVLANQKSSKIFFYIGAWTIVLSLCLYSFFKDPPQIYDIYRHYELIDYLRCKKWSISYTVLEGVSKINSNYSSCYVYNLWVAIIAKFLPNGSLPFMAVLLYYSVFMYVYSYENKEKPINNLGFLISFMLCSITMPYLYIYSGIRNSSAVALAALGIYRYFRVKKNIVTGAMLIVVGVLIHPFAGVAVVVLIFYRFKPKLIWFIFIILFPILIEPIMEWCRLKSGNEFLFRIGVKYYNYTKVRKDNQGMVYYLNSIIVTLMWCIMILMHFITNNRGSKKIIRNSYEVNNDNMLCVTDESQEKLDSYLLSGLWWYTIFSLAFIDSTNIMLRFPFFLGCFAPLFVRRFLGDSLKRHYYSFSQVFSLVSILMLFVLVIYENIAWLK